MPKEVILKRSRAMREALDGFNWKRFDDQVLSANLASAEDMDMAAQRHKFKKEKDDRNTKTQEIPKK
jgi:uncharacterized membrane protein